MKKKTSPKPTSGQPLYPKEHLQRVVEIVSERDVLEPYRSPFRRDYARLIHSAAFRRLQGKTQLFPGKESDFFRNRLTHSLEVAQIAKSIAIRFNYENDYFRNNPIDTDLVEIAALAHDLGHPPFGHNGEKALDECMKAEGGFEGNAQTLRILARLEKKQTLPATSGIPDPIQNGEDARVGLNLTFRTLAAVLKYDEQIPPMRSIGSPVAKGYYYTEADLVSKVRSQLGLKPTQRIRTIECSIMDIADDIAYSTYDLEDAFKAGFLSPISMTSVNTELATRVAQKATKGIQKAYPDHDDLDAGDVYATLVGVFDEIWDVGAETLEEFRKGDLDPKATTAYIASTATDASNDLAEDGYYRSQLTSYFVGLYIGRVALKFDPKSPMLSEALLDPSTLQILEIMKNYAYEALIMSPRLKVAEHRGKDIVRQIFHAISGDEGYLLMPSDFKTLHEQLTQPAEKKRAICDFIAGMTDRYAVQFYGRLFGTNAETIFSPL